MKVKMRMMECLMLFRIIKPHNQACDALETVLTYLQQQAHVPESTTVTINSLLIETNKKRYNNLKQTKLSKYFNKQ